MTDNLNLGSVPDATADLETVVTDILRDVDAAMSEILDIDCTAGGAVLLTASQATRAKVLTLTGTPAGAFTLDIPATHTGGGLKVLIGVINQSGQTATVQVDGGAGAGVAIADAANQLVYSDSVDVFGF